MTSPIKFLIVVVFSVQTISLTMATNNWEVLPIIKLDENKNPTRCGYLYESRKDGIVLRIEKYVLNNHVITTLIVESKKIKTGDKVGIITKSFDSFREFKISESRDFFFQASGNLEKSKSGGVLFYELAIIGGSLVINNKHTLLPKRLPREISALYLNCAGDLIRPENEIR